jgi:anthranilate synthase component 2
MILLIDNYDSFSYNLVQLIGSIIKEKAIIENKAPEEILVIRNDEMTAEDIRMLNPSHIILSPGPGRPSDAGICEEAVKVLKGRIPILGVCLGHQGICEAFGGVITFKGLMKKLWLEDTTLWQFVRIICLMNLPLSQWPTTEILWL